MSLKNKAAIVTGGESGIRQAIVLRGQHRHRLRGPSGRDL